MEHSPVTATPSATAQKCVTAFVCANCARDVQECGPRARHLLASIFPEFCQLQVITIPCSGRLQPEHLLRAIEAGADLVCIVACEEHNCHFLEGSARAPARSEYVQQLLAEIGVGGERLLLLHLPGSAREDMAAGESRTQLGAEGEASRTMSVAAAEIAARLGMCSANPLHQLAVEELVPDTQDGEENED